MHHIKVIFFGSSKFSYICLSSILNTSWIDIVTVVTPPDKASGRGLKIKPCYLKNFCIANRIPCVSSENVNSPSFIKQLINCVADIFIVSAFGQILKSEILSIPRYGCINVHPSLLPKYRGGAPIQWAIANGEKITGVSIFIMNEKMDEGDIIIQRSEPIYETDTYFTLSERLAAIGGTMLIEILEKIVKGDIKRIPQDHTMATYAPLIKKEDAIINWNEKAWAIYNKIRAFVEWPVCRFALGGDIKENRYLLIHEAKLIDTVGMPGIIIDLTEKGIIVGASDKALELTLVQPEGGKIMTGRDFANGKRLKKGMFIWKGATLVK